MADQIFDSIVKKQDGKYSCTKTVVLSEDISIEQINKEIKLYEREMSRLKELIDSHKAILEELSKHSLKDEST